MRSNSAWCGRTWTRGGTSSEGRGERWALLDNEAVAEPLLKIVEYRTDHATRYHQSFEMAEMSRVDERNSHLGRQAPARQREPPELRNLRATEKCRDAWVVSADVGEVEI